MQNDFMKAMQNGADLYLKGLSDLGAQYLGQSAAENAGAPWAQGMEQFVKLFSGAQSGFGNQTGANQSEHLFEQVMSQGKAYVSMLEKLYQSSSQGTNVDFSSLAKQWLDELSKANPFMQLPNFNAAGFQMPNAFSFDPSMMNAQHFLNMPAFGSSRESQERHTDLIKQMQAYMEAMQGYQALQNKSMKMAIDRMQSKVEERNQPGRELDSLKAIYDLWIDALEESFAEVALSPEYQTAYGRLVDAQMRVRANVQKQIELASGQFGMPTRTELEGVHQKLAEVRRTMRSEIAELRAEIESLKSQVAPSAVDKKESGKRPTSEAAAPVKAAAKSVPVKKVPAKVIAKPANRLMKTITSKATKPTKPARKAKK
jgi:polyhydroxyalkanoate synthase subunit PhaE